MDACGGNHAADASDAWADQADGSFRALNAALGQHGFAREDTLARWLRKILSKVRLRARLACAAADAAGERRARPPCRCSPLPAPTGTPSQQRSRLPTCLCSLNPTAEGVKQHGGGVSCWAWGRTVRQAHPASHAGPNHAGAAWRAFVRGGRLFAPPASTRRSAAATALTCPDWRLLLLSMAALPCLPRL